MARTTKLQRELNKSKAAIYIRVSTHWQIDKDSLKVQRRELEAYSTMVLGINDFEIFEDPGYSAKNTYRPEYQRMMNRLRTGEFTHLLVWKIDRISRNLLDFSNMYAELKRLGVVFVSKNEQFDTSSAIGEAMLKIILVFAELERNMTSERVSAVMLSRASNGQWNGGRIPYGYSYDKEMQTFSPCVGEAEVVKKMYDLYEVNQSVIYVVRRLNEQGVKTRAGKLWTAPSVHKILSNVFYEGKYKYNVYQEGSGYKKKDESEWIIFDDHHEPIISEEQFKRVQFLLTRNRRGGWADGETHTRNNVHIFAGLVKCGICGSNMSATLDRSRANGWRPSLYGCSMRRNNAKACDNKYITDVKLGPFVFQYVSNILKARNSFSARTTLKAFENKLLRSKQFAGIDHIEEEGLQQMYDLLKSGASGVEYKPATVFSTNESSVSETTMLRDQRKKYDNALNRLKSLYLYNDKELTEKEYIVERQRIIDEMNKIDKRLAEIASNEFDNSVTEDELNERASYFILVDKLITDKPICYGNNIRPLDKNIQRSFVRSIISKIEVTQGKVTAIEFKNGITHRFIYSKMYRNTGNGADSNDEM